MATEIAEAESAIDMALVAGKKITAAGRDITTATGTMIRAANAGTSISWREWFVGWVPSISQLLPFACRVRAKSTSKDACPKISVRSHKLGKQSDGDFSIAFRSNFPVNSSISWLLPGFHGSLSNSSQGVSSNEDSNPCYLERPKEMVFL